MGAIAVLVIALAGLGFIVYEGLSSATLYFRNADEAVAQRDGLGTKRFRIQGTVGDDVTRSADGVRFTISYADSGPVHVRHVGDPPELFKPGIPVVLEGHWDAAGEVFDSDRIMVKHSADYVAENGDRLTQAEKGS
jgi:cytochrome c-type biogenesis protein CcmE